MVQKRTYRPRLEGSLEDRITPSAAASTSIVAVPLAKPRQMYIMGTINGTTMAPTHQNPDVGTQLTLRGSGQLTALGYVGLTGSLHESGFIKVGHDHGLLTLSSRRGSVILKLDRTVDHSMQSMPADPPYNFSIVAGSGAYRGANGTGTAQFEFGGPLRQQAGPQGGTKTIGSFLLALNEPLPQVALPL